jgi:hypothetical protein
VTMDGAWTVREGEARAQPVPLAPIHLPAP